MTVARSHHTATLLPNGKVLIAGGGSRSIELYDPASGAFTAPGAKTLRDQVGTATLLPDGKVLLIEAVSQGSLADEVTFARDAEIYDPVTGAISATGSVLDYQYGYSATLLSNGQVLVASGFRVAGCCGAAADAELYDPATQAFRYTKQYADTGAPLSTPGGINSGVLYTSAALLGNGKVLIPSEPAAQLYDPSSGAFSRIGAVFPFQNYQPVFVAGRASTLLATGNVLITGGDPGDFDEDTFPVASSELYDPVAGTFRPSGDMALQRWSHTATLLSDGTVLIIGGIWPSGGVVLAELYNPASGSFSAAGNMNSGRVLQQATLLADGRVLVTGGQFLSSDFRVSNDLASAELYTPAVLTPAPKLFSGAIWHAATGVAASPSNPAVAGEILSLYTTGLIDGGKIPPQVSIGGKSAEVLYFGSSGYPGYSQINLRVPNGVMPDDSAPVRLTYINRPSNTVTIGVK